MSGFQNSPQALDRVLGNWYSIFMETMKTTYDDAERVAHLSSGQVIYNFHKSAQCSGEVCPVHNPSNHQYSKYLLEFDFNVFSFFRNVDGEKIIDPDDYNYNNKEKIIIKNSAICLSCNEEIFSLDRHDFVRCACGKTAVDGGSSYLRRVFDSEFGFKETSIVIKGKGSVEY